MDKSKNSGVRTIIVFTVTTVEGPFGAFAPGAKSGRRSGFAAAMEASGLLGERGMVNSLKERVKRPPRGEEKRAFA
jgi:hypothetical protein